ncbi:MAG: glutamyl-tRNA reductase, partial [Candidatus Latescibacteria bacterium]|nr:glutamyl-tRNA reductase [Candidatus Latescibacterota bacterium]
SSGELVETVVLSTCNRSEIYATTNGAAPDPRPGETWFYQIHGLSDGDLTPYLYRLTDEAAIRHLFRVVSSLDSMVVGEQQILGQVKEAYLRSLEEQTTGVILNRLFERALEVGKLVRETTDIGVGAVSVSSVAVELAKKIFKDLGRHTAMLIGAGETSELTARYLVENGIKTVIVANRTHERAVELAERIDGRAVRFEEARRWMTEVDIVISSTGAPHYILSRDEMVEIMHDRRNRPIFLIDIAVPRDIDPQARSVYNVFLYDIDDLQSVVDDNAERRRKEGMKAERIIEEEVARFLSWYRGLAVTPTIAQLRQYADQVRTSEVERALARLKHLSEADHKTIEQMSQALVNKLLHTPTVRLKASSDPGRELQYLHALRHLFGLDEEKQ